MRYCHVFRKAQVLELWSTYVMVISLHISPFLFPFFKEKKYVDKKWTQGNGELAHNWSECMIVWQNRRKQFLVFLLL